MKNMNRTIIITVAVTMILIALLIRCKACRDNLQKPVSQESSIEHEESSVIEESKPEENSTKEFETSKTDSSIEVSETEASVTETDSSACRGIRCRDGTRKRTC